jgi:hypothetical protein
MTEGTHSLTVQPDGVGVVEVEVSIKTNDGALIRASYSGVSDLGLDGYKRVQDGSWPASVPVRVVPRFLTAASKYAWLNRVQCVGFGELRPRDRMYSYDLYGLY